ncbi:hypothetical protein IJE86_02320 [bacterium]|nr:hypothetical protein [bacterium]
MNFKKLLYRILKKDFINLDLMLCFTYLPSDDGNGFQAAEANYLLTNIERSANYTLCKQMTTGIKYPDYPTAKTNKRFKRSLRRYLRLFPNVKNRFFRVDLDKKYNVKLAYGLFANAIYPYLKFFEENKIPFMFTLYPGGGFSLNNPLSDSRLRELFSSPMFKKVIVTMPITKKYLLENNFCSEDKIEYIYGGVPQNKEFKNKLKYQKDKSTFDVCFVAHKYTSIGEDKGFDVVVDVARRLIKSNKDIHFHFVGPWENILDVSDISSENLHFYGLQKPQFFVDFYSKMDIMLSPNRFQMINLGNFDGFPLGIEGAFAGVYLMCADPLNMKPETPLHNGKGFEVINHNPQEICDKILSKMKNLDELYSDSLEQQKLAQTVFGTDGQLYKRLEIIKREINI